MKDSPHPAITSYTCNITSSADCERVFAEIGEVHALVANAAIYNKGFLLDQSAADFSEHFDVNVLGVVNPVRAVLPGMLARNHGRIIVLGSLADANPLPGSIAYSMSKGALHAFVKGLAAEIDPRFDVTVNEFNPGATRTRMSEGGGSPEEAARHILHLVEHGRKTGRMFLRGKEVGSGLRAKIKRLLG